MNKYILISITHSDFVFSTREKLNEKEESSLNKGFPYLDTLFYDKKYFKRSINSISKTLQNFVSKNHINKMVINDESLIDTLINVFSFLKLPYLYVLAPTSLSIYQYEKILSNPRIKYFQCYYIPELYKTKFKNKNVQFDLKYDNNVSDEFLLSIDCINHETLYYKKNINIKKTSDSKLEDLEEFLKINQKLKNIHLHNYTIEYLEKIVAILKRLNKKHVFILLYQEDNLEYIKNNFTELKTLNKKYKKHLMGEIKIIYSKGFVKNNLFKQLSYNNLKIILFIIIYISFVAIFFSEFYSYIAEFNINKLNYEIINTPIQKDEESNEENSGTKLEKIFPTLLSINQETVGWLYVSHTNINYPVVKHSDNNYYLNRDFYKTKTKNGWIYMDFRNNIDNLDTNTIIYGHRLKDQSMFGTLNNVLDRTWHTKEENLIVKFDTLHENMNWQVFSVYRVDYTIDYLETRFDSEEKFEEFKNLITNRSIYNFKTDVNFQDKILTLSTCIGDENERLVLHAKLIK